MYYLCSATMAQNEHRSGSKMYHKPKIAPRRVPAIDPFIIANDKIEVSYLCTHCNNKLEDLYSLNELDYTDNYNLTIIIISDKLFVICRTVFRVLITN